MLTFTSFISMIPKKREKMKEFRDNIQTFYDFYIIVLEGNLSNAAEKIGVTKSNLSKRITNLENALNVKLLNRTNKGIHLTADGERLFKKLKEAFDNLNIKEEIEGTLIIGSTRNIADNVLADYLCKFYEKHPKVKIKIITDSASNLNNYLLNHRIDVLIDYLPQINFSEKDGFEIKFFSEFKTCFACNLNFFEKEGKRIQSLKQLQTYKLIIPGSSRRRQFLDEVLQKNNIELKPIMEMPDSKLMINIVEKEEFIGYFIEKEIEKSSLIKLNLKEIMPINSFGVIYSKKRVNKLVEDFIGSID